MLNRSKIDEPVKNRFKPVFTKMLNFSKGSFFKKTGSTINRLTGLLITGLTSPKNKLLVVYERRNCSENAFVCSLFQ